MSFVAEGLFKGKISDLYNSFSTSCISNVDENLAYSYAEKEYHYTLYYYDQAGNLVQTVPPEGVRPIDGSILPDVLDGIVSAEPDHKMLTHYKYNSLNQLVWQRSPDGGSTNFFYDDKGRLRMSQNAEQAKVNKYSYTNYDRQGRVNYVSELDLTLNTLSFEELYQKLEDEINFTVEKFLTGDFSAEPEDPILGITVLTDNISVTLYDKPFFSPLIPENTQIQENTRNRVSATMGFENSETGSIVINTFSYDAHGNVKTMYNTMATDGLNGVTKRIDYEYDLISGNVNHVFYQYGEEDQFIHHYEYDLDNRLIKVSTSHDGYIWNKDAEYFYYAHGPLARVELGEHNVQGIDYYYTLQGWLKGINKPHDDDTGGDGTLATMTGADEFALALGYFDGDYSPIGAGATVDDRDALWTKYGEINSSSGLYNGNIAWMATQLPEVGRQNGNANAQGYQAMTYNYDQLNRIVEARSLTDYTPGIGFGSRAATEEAFDVAYSYDANGNLKTLDRYDGMGAVSDDFDYVYEEGTNKLLKLGETFVPFIPDLKVYDEATMVDDGQVYKNIIVESGVTLPAGSSAHLRATESLELRPGFTVEPGASFISEMIDESTLESTDFQYEYDDIGNLVRDNAEGTTISWLPNGKVNKVTKDNGDVVYFGYDASGNRVMKKTIVNGETTYLSYVRDASGNVMATYENEAPKDWHIYGSTRLGTYTGGTETGKEHLGNKQYELSNHLGNVMAVISDRLWIADQGTTPPGDPGGPPGGGPGGGGDPDAPQLLVSADVLSVSDYYPFGLTMPGREFSSETYRYGFNGKEKDDKGEWGQTHYDYGFRIYNPQIAKFLSVDPLTCSYPMLTPYQFASNIPTLAVDLDGLESSENLNYNEGGKSKSQVIAPPMPPVILPIPPGTVPNTDMNPNTGLPYWFPMPYMVVIEENYELKPYGAPRIDITKENEDINFDFNPYIPPKPEPQLKTNEGLGKKFNSVYDPESNQVIIYTDDPESLPDWYLYTVLDRINNGTASDYDKSLEKIARGRFERGVGINPGKNQIEFIQGYGASARKITTNIPDNYTKTNYRIKGQPVYTNGKSFISPDTDGHKKGSVWKKAKSFKDLGKKETRDGTYDKDLNRIGD